MCMSEIYGYFLAGQNMSQNSGGVNQNLMANALPTMANAASMLQYPQVFQGQLNQQVNFKVHIYEFSMLITPSPVD